MPTFQIDLLGVPEVEKAFQVLPFKFQRQVLSQSIRDGAKLLQYAVVQAAPVDSGALRDTIRVRSAKVRSSLGVGMVVITGKREELGIPEKTRLGSPRGYYPASIEYGWHPVGRGQVGSKLETRIAKRNSRYHKQGETYTVWRRLKDAEFGSARTPGTAFMSETFHSMKDEVISTIAAGVTRRMNDLAATGPQGEPTAVAA